MNTRSVLSLVAWGFFLSHSLPVTALAQTASPSANNQEPATRIKTELLQLRAVVTDKRGKLIEGLQAEEFELLENNRLQKIEFFGSETIPTVIKEQPTAIGAKAPASPTLAPPVKPTRTIALFVDNVHLTSDSLDRTKQTLRRFVNDQMTESDLVCIVAAAGNVGIVNQFTQDRQLLMRAIEKLSLWRVNETDTLFSPYLAARVASNNPEAIILGMMILDSEDRFSKGVSIEVLEAEVRAKSAIILSEASYRRKTMLSTLKTLTERLAELPGQRLLFHFSEGFSLAGNGGSYDSDDLTPTISRAVRCGVMFYTVGAQGLTVQMFSASHPGIVEGGRVYRLSGRSGRVSGPPPTVPSLQSYMTARNNDQRTGMIALALDTGGKPFFETNDLNGRLAQALEENRIYYALSYYPDDFGNPNKERKLTLRVKGHPEYEVRTQRSYVPAELLRAEKDSANLTSRQRLARAMISPLPVSALGISVAADYFEREGDPNQVLLQTYIEGDKLDYRQQEGAAYNFNLEVATAIYDDAGKLLNGWSDEIKGDVKTEKLEVVKNAGFRQFKWLALKPGLYQVRVGIMEAATERLGTAMAWVEVPRLGQNKLLLSNMMLMQQVDAQTEATKSSSMSQFRQGIRLYQRGEVLAYFLRIYPPKTQKQADEEITIQTQIVQGDRIIFQSQWIPINARTVARDRISAEISGELKLNTIKPGLYELRAFVKEPKVTQPLQRAVLFSVEP